MLITSPMFLPVTPVPCFAGTDTVNFQIHILNASCNEWDASLIQQVMFEIQQSLVGVVTARCDECIQGSDAIMLNMEPMCNAQRTIIRGVISRETEDVFCTLNSWHQSGSAVRFRNTLHLIDRTCNFKVESLSSTICSGVTTEEVIIEQQASSAAASSAAAVGALLVVATAVIISVAAAVFVHRRYTKTFVVVFHVQHASINLRPQLGIQNKGIDGGGRFGGGGPQISDPLLASVSYTSLINISVQYLDIRLIELALFLRIWSKIAVTK